MMQFVRRWFGRREEIKTVQVIELSDDSRYLFIFEGARLTYSEQEKLRARLNEFFHGNERVAIVDTGEDATLKVIQIKP
jgi:hypothetical protein